MQAVQVIGKGGTDVLQCIDVDVPTPSPGEALVRIQAIGVNYLDIFHRTGAYRLPVPFTVGSEAAGVIEAVAGDSDFRVGDRVGFVLVLGTYAEYAVVPLEQLILLPADIDTRTAAAALMQGLTAHYLATSTFPLAPGDTALVHAAGGGTGRLLVQMAKKRGARVVATASTPKIEVAQQAGADCVIDYTRRDFEEDVLNQTAGEGVSVVYDSVGQTTFDKSLSCVRKRGLLVLYGQTSGIVEPFKPFRLAQRGVYLTFPSLSLYVSTREELLRRAGELFTAISRHELTIRIANELPLDAAAEAHNLLENRSAAGKILLIP